MNGSQPPPLDGPRAYLRHLQEQHARRKNMQQRVPPVDELVRRYDGSPQMLDIVHHLDEIAEARRTMHSDMLDGLLRWTTSPDARRLRNETAVGEVLWWPPDASVSRCPPEYGGYVICIYAGLEVLFHEVANIVYARAETTPGTYSDDPYITPATDYDNAVRLLGRVLRKLRERRMPKLPDGALPVRDDRFVPMGMLKVYASMFTVAHEFAHITLGHLDTPQSPTQEYEADSLGFDLVHQSIMRTSADNGQVHVGLSTAIAACEIEMLCFDAVRSVLGSGDGTHPAGSDRALALRRSKVLGATFYEYADMLTRFTAQLLSKALSAAER
jgi:hypothetical protein